MFCSNCGFQIPDGSKFCPNCGFQVSKATQTEKITPGTRKPKTPRDLSIFFYIPMGLHALSGILALLFLGALARAGALIPGLFSIIFDIGLVYCLWRWGLQPLKENRLADVIKTAKVYVIGVGLLLIVPLLRGNVITLVLQGIAVGCVGYIWYTLKDEV